MSKDIYQEVTDKIISQLEKGTVPWRHFASSPLANPANAVSKKAYRGINHFLLSGTDHRSQYWLTFKQALDLGGNVRKGEKSQMVVFWKFSKYIDKESGEEKSVPLLRHYNVFNIDQTEGIDWTAVETEPRISDPIEEAEALVANMPKPPTIETDYIPQAYYSNTEDKVHMTNREDCVSDARYYEVLLHELAHSTGHQSRLDRFKQDGVTHKFGSKSYAIEELVAQMTAAFLCSGIGIYETIEENSAAYIQNWLNALKNDKTMIVKAAGKAQKAADFIKGESSLDKHSESV